MIQSLACRLLTSLGVSDSGRFGALDYRLSAEWDPWVSQSLLNRAAVKQNTRPDAEALRAHIF